MSVYILQRQIASRIFLNVNNYTQKCWKIVNHIKMPASNSIMATLMRCVMILLDHCPKQYSNRQGRINNFFVKYSSS